MSQSIKKNQSRDINVVYQILETDDYHGVISMIYSPSGKYEELIMLTLFCETREPIWFYAEMSFNDTYTEVDSVFGYRIGSSKEIKKIVDETALFEVSEKLESNQPITLPVFIDLVSDILIEIYGIRGKVILFNIPQNQIEKYYERNNKLYSDEAFSDYFYASKSVFHCMLNKSEELVIDDYNSAEFPEMILSFSWLKKLELYELLISEIPEKLTNLGNLISLTLKLKFLTKLPSSIFRLKNLEVLKIERTGISELNKNLFDLSNLKELHITDNQDLSVIPDEISKLTSLEFLYIYGNKIKSLPKTIAGLEKLRVLHLANNMIENLPQELTALPNLQVLNLSNNRLKSIPEFLFEMESIKEIVLTKNWMLNQDKAYGLLMKSVRRDSINLVM